MSDEFDFGPPPDDNNAILQQEITDLKVLIDTLQTNLRSAESVIKKYEPECGLFKVPSYIWCTKWPGD